MLRARPAILCILFATSLLSAQTKVWQPTPGHKQIPLWPGKVPDSRPAKAPESFLDDAKSTIAGKHVQWIDDVSTPTMTLYSPVGKNTGAAVLVFPGGGYIDLAINLEGTEVCEWLNKRGISCILLKYRVPAPRSAPDWGAYPQSPMALEDAQRAMGMIRLHAAEWHINPHKLGVLGFSAGGHLTAAISTHFQQRLYPAIDAADKESCRPDFSVTLYPGHLRRDDSKFELNPAVPVTAQTPPTFLVQAEDDKVDNINNSLVYYIALKNAGVPVEMHLYAQGGHAFGLRHTDKAITDWPRLMQRWLKTIGILTE